MKQTKKKPEKGWKEGRQQVAVWLLSDIVTEIDRRCAERARALGIPVSKIGRNIIIEDAFK